MGEPPPRPFPCPRPRPPPPSPAPIPLPSPATRPRPSPLPLAQEGNGNLIRWKQEASIPAVVRIHMSRWVKGKTRPRSDAHPLRK